MDTPFVDTPFGPPRILGERERLHFPHFPIADFGPTGFIMTALGDWDEVTQVRDPVPSHTLQMGWDSMAREAFRRPGKN